MEQKVPGRIVGLALLVGMGIGMVSSVQAAYWVDSRNEVVKNSFGECWKDQWSTAEMRPECGDAIADADGDGVADDSDKCPNTPRGAKVDADGCELDSDGDGVVDSKDRCPDTARGAKVDSHGCELKQDKDSDGDGVLDSKDRCPGTPKGAAVDRYGCELDSDGDGVVDSKDACPSTPRGAKVDSKGCEIIRNITIDLVNDEFDFDKAVLKPGMKKALDGVAKRIKASKGDEHLQVIGHTDSMGSDAYNQGLSERRAKATADYLISRGVKASSVQTKGMGESSPAADNSTKRGRAKNRRVAIHTK